MLQISIQDNPNFRGLYDKFDPGLEWDDCEIVFQIQKKIKSENGDQQEQKF